MKIVKLIAQNFKGLLAVEITPQGDVITIGGKNGAGKSSVLDAIWVALAGKAVAPPKPIRNGEQQCLIVLDLGEVVITRTFTDKGEGKITDTVKVESGDGKQRFNSPQAMLDSLMGAIGFDPLAFVQMKPEAQAEMLLELVPLSIDLEAMAREDTADYANRRDKNRDAEQLRGQIAAIPLDESVPAEPIDREAIIAELAIAADTNGAIEREKAARENKKLGVAASLQRVDGLRTRANDLRAQADRLDATADSEMAEARQAQSELDALPPIAELVDTAAVRERLREAEETNVAIERQARRRDLAARLDALTKESQALTDAMADRERGRKQALASAKMPIDGLAFVINEKGKPVVELNGVPFEQASTAEQIRASTAIAMSANPELRVLRIKDASLLDEDSLAIITSMTLADDFQLLLEVVGTGDVSVIIEAGEVKGAAGKPEPAAKGKSKPEPADDSKAGQLL